MGERWKKFENNSSQFHIPFLSNICKDLSNKKSSSLKDFNFKCLDNKLLDWKVVLIFSVLRYFEVFILKFDQIEEQTLLNKFVKILILF